MMKEEEKSQPQQHPTRSLAFSLHAISCSLWIVRANGASAMSTFEQAGLSRGALCSKISMDLSHRINQYHLSTACPVSTDDSPQMATVIGYIISHTIP